MPLEPNSETSSDNYFYQHAHQHLALQALDRYQIGYLLLNEDLTILAGNDLIHCWIQEPVGDLRHRLVTDVFPELIGAEADLRALFDGGPVYRLRQVQRPQKDPFGAYFDLHIEPAKDAERLLLLTVLDVTTQTRHQQRIQQQRNEKHLLAAELTAAQEQLQYLFKRFVPEPVAQEILASNRMPSLGGEVERVATVLFADMRGFTAIAEPMTPSAVMDLLNEYLAVVSKAALRHGATLVQVVGDMVMGVFNLPGLQPDHAKRAIEASIDIQRSLQQHVQEKKAMEPAAGFGIGISTGHVVAGFLGMEQRYRYAVVGDTTNVAFYLCSQAKAGEILLCEHTVAALDEAGDTLPPGAALMPIGDVWPKRRVQAVRIFSLRS